MTFVQKPSTNQSDLRIIYSRMCYEFIYIYNIYLLVLEKRLHYIIICRYADGPDEDTQSVNKYSIILCLFHEVNDL